MYQSLTDTRTFAMGVGLALTVMILGWAHPVYAAQEPRIAVVPVTTDGSVTDVALSRIRSSLLEGLQEGQVQVVAPKDILLADPRAAECTDSQCLSKLAGKLGVPHALSVQISSEQRDYTVSFLMADESGAITKSSKKCVICGFDEVATMVHDEAVALATKVKEQPSSARLTVQVAPAGAHVVIDGKPAGTAPLTQEVTAGPHTIRVSLDGYTTLERDVVSVAATNEVLELELEKNAVSKPKAMRTAGWTLLGVGVATVGAGAGVLAMHHKPAKRLCTSEEDVNEDGLCRWRYNTLGVGAAVLAVGAAAAITGVVLTSLGYRKRPRDRASLDFGPGSVTLSVRY